MVSGHVVLCPSRNAELSIHTRTKQKMKIDNPEKFFKFSIKFVFEIHYIILSDSLNFSQNNDLAK